ncbi:MAG: HEAT repeat domain-containing protein [Tepidisphaerales bacterium]
MLRLPKFLIILAILFLGPSPRIWAYIDLAPTLGKLVGESQKIAVIDVDRFSRDKGAVILKKVRDIKDQVDAQPIRHQVSGAQGNTVPRDILEWAEPGQKGVLFVSGNTTLVCMGRNWYQVQSSADGWWKLGPARPDLPLAYCGTVSRLSDAVELMLANKTAIITTVPHGADNEAASFDLALNRTNYPGLVRVQRLRASLRMPGQVMQASGGAGYVVGQGQASAEEIPALIGKLASPDATIRAESADDLRSLGAQARSAVPALAKLLDDPSVPVRMSAAAALLRIAPEDGRALAVLSQGLGSADAAVRRRAARSAGAAGASAAPLADKLAALLSDSDELTRLAALQAIGTLGPAAAGAMNAVVKLLDDPQTAPDAADALGRMGPAARPAQKRLAKMLSADAVTLRWAAVRAMSQIGGEDASPAVQFMIGQLRDASEVDGYNMMIYLGLLGPVASEAIPAIQNARIKQPALKPAALWAIEPDKSFPWQNSGRGGGFMQESDVVVYIYEAYVSELGDHLRPASRVLAQKLMAGSAGQVPTWAYKLLARFPDEAIGILAPALADKSIVQRERAVVALGFMGPPAAPARTRVAEALKRAPTEREQLLIKWCLREIGGETVSARTLQ